jgi:hypothetical protein
MISETIMLTRKTQITGLSKAVVKLGTQSLILNKDDLSIFVPRALFSFYNDLAA